MGRPLGGAHSFWKSTPVHLKMHACTASRTRSHHSQNFEEAEAVLVMEDEAVDPSNKLRRAMKLKSPVKVWSKSDCIDVLEAVVARAVTFDCVRMGTEPSGLPLRPMMIGRR